MQMQRKAIVTTFVAAMLASHNPAMAQDFNLNCNGGGTSKESDVTTGSITDAYGRTTTGQVSSYRNYNFAEGISIEISGASGRIRMPRNLLPVIKGGNNGWFNLEKVAVSDREITATAKVNFLNKPKISIDRMNGTVSINSSSGSFFGQCSNYDADQSKRAF